MPWRTCGKHRHRAACGEGGLMMQCVPGERGVCNGVYVVVVVVLVFFFVFVVFVLCLTGDFSFYHSFSPGSSSSSSIHGQRSSARHFCVLAIFQLALLPLTPGQKTVCPPLRPGAQSGRMLTTTLRNGVSVGFEVSRRRAMS